MEELTLKEEFLLLSLDDEKGNFIPNMLRLNYTLAGAILLELTTAGKITLDDKKINVTDPLPMDDSVNDDVLITLKNSPSKTIGYWVNYLGNDMKDYRTVLIKSLINKGILRQEEGNILWVFPKTYYPLANIKPENDIKRRLYKILLENKAIDNKSMMLIALLKASRISKEIFIQKEDYKLAKEKINSISESLEIGKSITRSITAIESAVIVAVTASIGASIAAATSSSNSR